MMVEFLPVILTLPVAPQNRWLTSLLLLHVVKKKNNMKGGRRHLELALG